MQVGCLLYKQALAHTHTPSLNATPACSQPRQHSMGHSCAMETPVSSAGLKHAGMDSKHSLVLGYGTLQRWAFVPPSSASHGKGVVTLWWALAEHHGGAKRNSMEASHRQMEGFSSTQGQPSRCLCSRAHLHPSPSSNRHAQTMMGS